MEQGFKILIVEDSPTQAEEVKYVLEKTGYIVSVANNGKEALAWLKNQDHLPDLIITDIIMPEMDGFELIKTIKSDPLLNEIQVILLTCLSDSDNILKGLEWGANNFITKPCDEQLLINRVNAILSNIKASTSIGTHSMTEYTYNGTTYNIPTGSPQVLDFMISSYETAIHKNAELQTAQDELLLLNTKLEERVKERTVELNNKIIEHRKVGIELENALEALKTSNMELEQFAYIASHDLQEPLRMVSSFVQLLSVRYKDKLDENANEFIGFAVDGAARLQRMIQDLLQFSRIQTQGEKMREIDVNKVLKQAIDNLQKSVDETEALISFTRLPHINGDESQLIRLFQNLISNSIKFCKDRKPEIVISSKQQADEYLFSVQDNGFGILPQHQEKVFRIFQRLNSREEFGGTGIGLAICKRIVERHHGKIWFESKAGEGTIFYFTIKKQGDN